VKVGNHIAVASSVAVKRLRRRRRRRKLGTKKDESQPDDPKT
jgi:hypothetical protein